MNKRYLCAAILAGLASISGSAIAGSGHETAQTMTRQYHDTRQDCGQSAPAFTCSGIILRSTTPSSRYHSWEHSPNSRTKGGVSFSYLRADAHIPQLAADAKSGYTLAPVSHRPSGSVHYRVLCAFPTDGDSWTRDKGGCGDNSQTTDVETYCHEQGITTAEQWVSQYEQTEGDPAKRYHAQCAFDMSTHRSEAIPEFMETLKAMKALNGRPFPWNEMLIEAWDEKEGDLLPIQSFFYIKGSYGGLEQARYDQNDFRTTTGRFVPIIEITLSERSATFIYRESDQGVSASDPINVEI